MNFHFNTILSFIIERNDFKISLKCTYFIKIYSKKIKYLGLAMYFRHSNISKTWSRQNFALLSNINKLWEVFQPWSLYGSFGSINQPFIVLGPSSNDFATASGILLFFLVYQVMLMANDLMFFITSPDFTGKKQAYFFASDKRPAGYFTDGYHF